MPPRSESLLPVLMVEPRCGGFDDTGTTLRTFLSKLLNCDPMRISKKFVGQNCIGKQVFRRRQVCVETNEVQKALLSCSTCANCCWTDEYRQRHFRV